jgi:hypothetical protein
MDFVNNNHFFLFVEDIKRRIKAAQYRALQAVNKEQAILGHWPIDCGASRTIWLG